MYLKKIDFFEKNLSKSLRLQLKHNFQYKLKICVFEIPNQLPFPSLLQGRLNFYIIFNWLLNPDQENHLAKNIVKKQLVKKFLITLFKNCVTIPRWQLQSEKKRQKFQNINKSTSIMFYRRKTNQNFYWLQPQVSI